MFCYSNLEEKGLERERERERERESIETKKPAKIRQQLKSGTKRKIVI
jgi:hypothetical protein